MTARTRRTALPAALAVVLATTLAGCGSEDDSRASEPTGTPTSSGSPSAEASPSESGQPSGSASSAEPVAAPVYFVGNTPTGPRLFREFRNVSADDPMDEALALLGSGDAQDPDYSTLVSGQLRAQSMDEAFLVEVADPGLADRPAGMSAKEANLAVQQVVYTVQGVLQERVPVGFVLASGDSTPLFGLSGPSETNGFQAADELDVLALVNVTEPGEGALASGTFTASGVASSFEGTVPWQVLDAGGQVVLEGSAQAGGWIDKLYPWQVQIDASGLAPGAYTFVARTDDPSDGEGAGPTQDTKTFIVQ